MDRDDYKGFCLATAAVVGLALSVYLLVTYRTDAQVEVTRVSWSRAIEIQQYQTVQESAWSIPQGGRETRHYEAFHHYNHIVTGSRQVCSGTGKTQTCSTQLTYTDYPVYQTRYDYDIDRWITVRTPERHGIGHNAEWPDVSDLKEGTALGSERAGTRISRYTVAFTRDYALDITEERWRGFTPGMRAVLILNIFRQAMDVRQVAS
jgi:hypothetical protein